MAVTINAKGTTVPYFKIGKGGTTLYQGSSDPSGAYSPVEDDIWFDTANNQIKFRTASSTWEVGGTYSDTNARAAISASGDISYDSGTGVMSYSTPALNGLTDVSTAGATNGQVLTYNSGTTSWEPTTVSGSGPSFQRAAVTSASYTMSSGDTFVGVNYAGAVTITMFNSQTAGSEIIIKDESGSASTNNITVNTTNSETIDGASSFVISTDYAALRLLWTGVEWSIV